MIIPITDCVNSISGKTLFMLDWGLKTPRRSTPLARGGNTKGIITIILMKKIPGSLYFDKQYASGIPNKDISSVEIDAVKILKNKALLILLLVNQSNIFIGSEKIIILLRGYKIYNNATTDNIHNKNLKFIILSFIYIERFFDNNSWFIIVY